MLSIAVEVPIVWGSVRKHEFLLWVSQTICHTGTAKAGKFVQIVGEGQKTQRDRIGRGVHKDTFIWARSQD